MNWLLNIAMGDKSKNRSQTRRVRKENFKRSPYLLTQKSRDQSIYLKAIFLCIWPVQLVSIPSKKNLATKSNLQSVRLRVRGIKRKGNSRFLQFPAH